MSAQRLVFPDTAFSVVRTKQRRPREKNEGHLAFIGTRFGLLEIKGFHSSIKNTTLWIVRCDCGTEKTVRRSNILKLQSCGCLQKQQMSRRNATHGLSRPGQFHPLYYTWDGIKRRCHGENPPDRYGGRGIYVCDRWRFGDGILTGFECFLADMGPRPSPRHSIDRYPDNNGPYSPENCRWATVTEQQRNRSSNRTVFYRGAYMTLIAAIEMAGQKQPTVSARLRKGWSVDQALDTPPMERSARPKQARVRDVNHLRFIRKLSCCICGAPDPDAAHIRSGNQEADKSGTGMQQKPSDKWVTPLCRKHHDEQHAAGNEIAWWAKQNIDPFGLALSLYAHSGDDEIAESILNAHRQRT